MIWFLNPSLSSFDEFSEMFTKIYEDFKHYSMRSFQAFGRESWALLKITPFFAPGLVGIWVGQQNESALFMILGFVWIIGLCLLGFIKK